jgi:hypothetical protein
MGLGPPPGFEADAFLEIHRQIMGQTGAAAEHLAAIEEVLPGMIMRSKSVDLFHSPLALLLALVECCRRASVLLGFTGHSRAMFADH